MGVASLVLGIVAAVLAFFPIINWVGIICGIGGIILGAIGKKNGGVANAGMIISIIGTAIAVIGWIACLACAASL